MSSASRRVRWAGVGIACVASVGLGLALVFRVVTPATLSKVQTPELLAMMGLLIMPGIAAWTVHTERRVRLRRARLAEAQGESQADSNPSAATPPHPAAYAELKLVTAAPQAAAAMLATPTPGRHAEASVADASAPTRHPSFTPAGSRVRGRRSVRTTQHTGSER